MANTVSLISYANTFGDWVVTTNALTKENNDLSANNYFKPTGTLYLNDPNLGLQVANNAIIAGGLSVAGVGSSVYVQNNLQVDKQVYFTNTTFGLTNSGPSLFGGKISANGSETGLVVANNATINGTLSVGGLETIDGTLTIGGSTTVSNTLTVTGSTTVSNDVVITGNTSIAKNVSSNNSVVFNNSNTSTLTVHQNATIGTTLSVGSDATITGNVSANYVYDNGIRLKTYIDTANTFLQSNDFVTLTVSKNYTDTSNASMKSYVDTANTNVTLYANGIVAANLITAKAYTDTSNSYLQTSISTAVSTSKITVSNLIDGNTASAWVNNLTVNNNLTTKGNFIINGATVYNSDTFTLNSNQTTGQNGYIVNNRGSSGANAVIRWNEISQYWDIRDVNNSTSYSKILTANLISDSYTTTSSSGIASLTAVSSLKSYVDTSNTNVILYTNGIVASNLTSAKAYTDTANTNLKSYVDTTYSNATNITSGTLSVSRLPISGATAGTYGGASQVPVLVVDTTGRVTSIANTAVAGVASYTYNPANSTFTLSTSAGTSYNATINQVTDFTVTGNLVINGTTTTVNTSTITTKDSLIKLADGNLSDSLDVGFYGQYVNSVKYE